MSGLEKQDLMLKTVVLEEEVPGISKVDVTQQTERKNQQNAELCNVPFTILPDENVELKGDTVRIKKGGARITIEWETKEAGEYYVCLGNYKIKSKERTYCDITMSCHDTEKTIRALKDTWNWYFGRERYLLNMGFINWKEQHTNCVIKFQSSGTFLKSDLKVYVQSMDPYVDTMAKRREDVLENVAIEKNRVGGGISVKEKKLLFLSIPYSDGWRADVDGKEAKILRADTAYMALELEPGSHQIELEYTTPFIRLGGGMTVLGCLVFAGYVWMSRRGEKRGV